MMSRVIRKIVHMCSLHFSVNYSSHARVYSCSTVYLQSWYMFIVSRHFVFLCKSPLLGLMMMRANSFGVRPKQTDQGTNGTGTPHEPPGQVTISPPSTRSETKHRNAQDEKKLNSQHLLYRRQSKTNELRRETQTGLMRVKCGGGKS